MYAQIVNICVQLATIPVLLHAWGSESLGWWIALGSVPALLAYGDFGIGTIAGNSVGMADAEGSRQLAADAYKTGRIATKLVALAVAVVVGAFVGAALAMDYTLGMPKTTFLGTSILLGLSGAVSIAIGYRVAVLRGLDRWHSAIYVTTSFRAVECVGSLVAAALGQGLIVAAAVLLICRVLNAIYLSGILKPATSEFRSLGTFDGTLLRSWIRPSVTFALMPLAQSSLLNLPLIFLGAAAGPAAVSIFAAARTATRIPLQVTNIVGTALAGPAMRMAKKDGIQAASQIVVKANGAAIAIAALVGLIVILSSPLLFAVWTSGKIAPEPQLMLWLAIAGFCAAAWNIPSNFLAALSGHGRFYFLYSIVSFVGLLLIAQASESVIAVAICIALVEACGVALALLEMRKVSNADEGEV